MKIGILLPLAGQQATRENIIQTAKLAEQEDFDSLWAFERLLWPLNPQTPYPATPDGTLPIEYQKVFDPLETLSYLAAITKKIALGTSVIDMLFHNPVVLARRFATLDVLSEGRAMCGLGIGWSKDEYQASNIPFINRGKRADEFIQALKKIWTEDVVEFKGEYYNIPASKIGPIASKANKDPNIFNVILLTYPNIDDSKNRPTNEGQRFPLTGTIDQIGSDIKRIKDMGVEHIIFGYIFIPVGRDVDNMIEKTKQLSKFAK
ncbi:MAG: fgd [Nitrososphaeraceae archaeon]|nr:fgd [Nitrososphaeraceae archaeon]